MFCPQCGQERTSDATSFCSRCGFLLTFTSQLLKTGGTPAGGVMDANRGPRVGSIEFQSAIRNPASAIRDPQLEDSQSSPRSRGVKMGLFMFLMTFLVAPILGMISVFAFGIRPWPMGIAIFLLGGGGLLRVAYALMFESKVPAPALPGEIWTQLAGPVPQSATRDPQSAAFLNPQSAIRDLQSDGSQFPQAGNWRDTNDLQPHSVTENTTRHLDKKTDLES